MNKRTLRRLRRENPGSSGARHSWGLFGKILDKWRKGGKEHEEERELLVSVRIEKSAWRRVKRRWHDPRRAHEHALRLRAMGRAIAQDLKRRARKKWKSGKERRAQGRPSTVVDMARFRA